MSPDPKNSLTNPLVSIILPAFNEEAIIETNVNTLYAYLRDLNDFDWEILIIDDGSFDKTGAISDKLALTYENLKVYHHQKNRNLGGALRTGFKYCKGDYVVVLDIDLSYAPVHIEKMLDEMLTSEADIVIASPYMTGGRNTAVPRFRLLLSKTINRIMRFSSDLDIHTYTSMARTYRGDFIRCLSLKGRSYDINPEIIQKADILRARIVEVPAHLDWSAQIKFGKKRTSSIKIFRSILFALMASFIFRPYIFFMAWGLVTLAVAIYVIVWIFVNTYLAFPDMALHAAGIEAQFTLAVAKVFNERPYSFFVGGTTLIIALQLFSVGFLSLQNKRYFDELYHVNTNLYRELKDQ